MDYFGAYIPDHLRLTQPKERRRHAGPEDKRVLGDMRRRQETCNIITLRVDGDEELPTKYCITHHDTFLTDRTVATCPRSHRTQKEVVR